MGEAILVGGRTGAVEQKIFKWKEYIANGTNVYYWNRWNAISTTTYYWNRFSTSIKYTWNQWNISYSYQWNKWNSVFGYNIIKAADGTTLINPSTNLCWAANEYSIAQKSSGNSGINWAWCFGLVNSTSGRWIKDHIKAGTLTGRIAGMGRWAGDNGVSGGSWWYIKIGICNGQYKLYDDGDGSYWYDLGYTQIWSLEDKWSGGTTSYGTVTSTNASAYPNGGRHTDGYWYNNRTTLYSRGSYVGTVTYNDNANAYPNGSWSGNYWYDGRTQATVKGGTSYGQVSSTNAGAYPSPGASGSYWYESAGSQISWSQGSTSYPEVSSTNSGAYPANDHAGDYWYIYNRMEIVYSQGEYVGDRLSTDRDRWPDNGYVNGYWYVFDGEA